MASITTFFGTQGGGGSVSGTATRVAFFGGTPGNPSTTLDDSANLEWDDTNSRLSVGDAATVGSTVTIASTTASDATSALEVRTSSAYADNLLFRVYDNGRIETRTLDSSEAVTDNIAIGFSAGGSMTTAIGNTIIGQSAGLLITQGGSNTIVGSGAGQSIATTSGHTFVGNGAGAGTTTGSNNTAVGFNALRHVSGTSENTAIGLNAGRYRGAGNSQNLNSTQGVYIGSGSRANTTGNTTNEIAIGYNTEGNGSNSATLGNLSVTDTYLQGNIHLERSAAIVFDTSAGTKIGSDPAEKLAFYGETPNVQPTTGITGATVSHVGGTSIGANDTFGGYTIAQIAAALIRLGLLA